MATNYYILAGNPKGTTVQVAFHVVVPGGNNAAGVAWQTAVAEYVAAQEGGTASLVPGLAAGEQTKLDAGQLVEYVEGRHFGGRLASDADRKANVETYVANRAVEITVELGKILQYWGETGSVT